MAAQRPGRFDKIILFNELTRDNIKNIILKSLFDNFKIKSKTNKFVNVMTDSEVVNLLFNKNVSGAYIYSTTKMMKLKIDMLKIENGIDVSWVVKEIETNLNTMNKLRNMDFLSDKINNSSTSGIGFENSAEDEEEEEESTETGYEYEVEDNPLMPEEGILRDMEEDIEYVRRQLTETVRNRARKSK